MGVGTQMVQISTFYHGDVDVEENQFFYFEHGLPGFETIHKYVLLPLEANNSIYQLQCAEDPNLVFLLLNPFVYMPEYEFTLPDSDKAELLIESEHDVEVWSILTVRDRWESSTINLLAPIVLNRTRGRGKQLILHDTPYRTRHLLTNSKEEETHARAHTQEG
jgi:flagellar assembly factor FliW